MPSPASSPDSNTNLFEVKKVIGRKETGGKVLYKVVWRGYSRSDTTWEPYENFVGDGALNCIKTFLEKRKAKKKAKEVADSSFIVDSGGEEEELNRRKLKKRKLNAKKRHPSLNQPCQINSIDDSGDDSAAPEVWLSEDDFEWAPPKRARFWIRSFTRNRLSHLQLWLDLVAFKKGKQQTTMAAKRHSMLRRQTPKQ